MTSMAEGWYSDPFKRYELRYCRNNVWSEHVSSGGVTSVDQPGKRSDDGGDVEIWWSSRRVVGSYLASHPAGFDRIESVGLGFLSLGFEAVDDDQNLVVSRRWENVWSVSIESADSIRTRVNETRVLLFGAIGLLSKKTAPTAYMTVADAGGEWVFAVENMDAAVLWSELLEVKARVPERFHFGVAPQARPVLVNRPMLGSVSSAKGRLVALDALRAKAQISDEEWMKQRLEIISSI